MISASGFTSTMRRFDQDSPSWDRMASGRASTVVPLLVVGPGCLAYRECRAER
jgi:hypothetical protein